MAYCAPADLLTGDMTISSKYAGGAALVGFAADEIDSVIGFRYVTPVVIADTPENRPSLLLLKRINILLASGRLIMDQAIGGEDNGLQAYGQSLLEEAKIYLEKIRDGAIDLVGAEELPTSADDENNAASITNEDPESLVETFYNRFQTTDIKSPITFYGDN